MKNGDVLKNLKTEKTLLHTIKARIINFFSIIPNATTQL